MTNASEYLARLLVRLLPPAKPAQPQRDASATLLAAYPLLAGKLPFPPRRAPTRETVSVMLDGGKVYEEWPADCVAEPKLEPKPQVKFELVEFAGGVADELVQFIEPEPKMKPGKRTTIRRSVQRKKARDAKKVAIDA